jgi:uncharacterized protein (TIGR00255 family)
MVKSMTGFSKVEAGEKGCIVSVELKSLNGRYLEFNIKLNRNITNKELEIREIVKRKINRGSVYINISFEFDEKVLPAEINIRKAEKYFRSLKKLKSSLKLKDEISMENLLHFSDNFLFQPDSEQAELEWKLAKSSLIKAVIELDRMRIEEGRQIAADIKRRIKIISDTLEKVDALGIDKIPTERDRLRARVAQLFESDEIDEHRLQMELVLLADKLDFSEECVRMRSHIKFFNELMKLKNNNPVGKKVNFLLQEMNREVNTIGSKCNDAEISQYVVLLKEEIEKIREQIQNIE